MNKSVRSIYRKSNLAKALSTLPEPWQEGVLEAYALLLKDNDLSDPMLAHHLKDSILPAVAMYSFLKQQGWSQEEALNLVRTSVLQAANSGARFFKTLSRMPFFFSIFRWMCRKGIQYNFGEKGWAFEWEESSPQRLAFTCHDCFYVNVLKRYNMPELTPIFCESDDVMYGSIPGLRWLRTKTIARGDAVCDFCFISDKYQPHSQMPPDQHGQAANGCSTGSR